MSARQAGRPAFLRKRVIAAMLVSLIAAPASVFPQSPTGGTVSSAEAEAGKRIYLEGVLPSGEPLRAKVRGDLLLSGQTSACANCHRRSGMGTREGRRIVRPVTGAALYRPEEVYDTGPTFPGGSDVWPAYTDETLARAIRGGVDPKGRILDAVMPRYAIADHDLSLLTSYLKSLTTAPPPGVTDNAIRFATVVDARVDPAKRNEMLDVLKTFFHDLSAGTRYEARRGRQVFGGKARRYRAYRSLELNVWELTGPEETWEVQLEEHYRQRPVFALVSGIVQGRWEPIHRFCERLEIPCLLPNTDWPVLEEGNYYTFYFSRGLALEAGAVARHMKEDRQSLGSGPIVQIFGDDGAETIAAAFREEMRKAGIGGLEDRRIRSGEALTAEFWRALEEGGRPAAVVLWMRNPDLHGLGGGGPDTPPMRVYLSASLGAGPNTFVPEALAGRVYLANPFLLPGEEQQRFQRTRIQLRARKIAGADERLQVNTFFAASLVGGVINQLLGYFSRDYFIELVEHETEKMLYPTAFPRVSLGPGQRFASKGCYILKYPKEAGAGMESATGWIVP